MSSNLSQWIVGDVNSDPNTLAKRDVNGCLTAADPQSSTNLATRNYVDNTAGSTSATASTLARRNADGTLTAADPTNSSELVTLNYINTKGILVNPFYYHACGGLY